jgi:hypothetical protein
MGIRPQYCLLQMPAPRALQGSWDLEMLMCWGREQAWKVNKVLALIPIPQHTGRAQLPGTTQLAPLFWFCPVQISVIKTAWQLHKSAHQAGPQWACDQISGPNVTRVSIRDLHTNICSTWSMYCGPKRVGHPGHCVSKSSMGRGPGLTLQTF